MHRTSLLTVATVLLGTGLCRGQVGGNIGYSRDGASFRAQLREQANRVLAEQDQPPPHTSFVAANVLMNVKADEFIAVFGIAEEGETVPECNRKMDDVVKKFSDALAALKVEKADIFVDFISQTRTYSFEIVGDVATEKLVGFELKKNLSVRYKDRNLLDKFVLAAAPFKIYDLIKVEYIVKDVKAVQDRLVEEASKVIKDKTARYEKLLGIKLQPPAQIYAEKFAAYYPTSMYDSYTAAESEEIDGGGEKGHRTTVRTVRKTQTFVYNPLDADGFDRVLDPVVIEPVVQFTIYLKVKYKVDRAKAR